MKAPRSFNGMPIMLFPTATPNRKLANKLDPKNPISHAPRQNAEAILLRNSIETARKISAKSSAMKGT